MAYTFVVIYEKEIDGEYQCEGRSDGGVSVATVHGEHLNKTEQEEAGNVREDDEGGRGPRKALYMSRRIRIMTRKLPVAGVCLLPGRFQQGQIVKPFTTTSLFTHYSLHIHCCRSSTSL